MAIQAVLARGWTVEIEDEATPGTYIKISGLNQIGFDEDETDADTTDFDSDGRPSHLVAQRGNTVTLEGYYKEDPVTGERDPGQAAVEALADKTGNLSLGKFRITSPAGNMKEFMASARVSGSGGLNDPMGWQAELRISGPITKTPAGTPAGA